MSGGGSGSDNATFDEVEDGDVLRNLVDWTLVNVENEMVSLDALGEGKPFCSVSGYLIKPLKKHVKTMVLDSLCTFGSVVKGDESRNVVVKEQLIKEPMVIDWDNLQVGDFLDGYCDKTFKWHKAKIVDIVRDDHKRIKVHFNGWKPKHDEWLHVGSTRLAALGQFTDIVMVDVEKPPLIPWYENSAINQKIQEMENGPMYDERVKVTISDIEDWCVDYSYSNPSLWLISHEGPWYRVMSPLLPGGGTAHPSYSSFFNTYLEKFVASAHCAFCLMDFLPINRKITYQKVVDEVDIRSGGRIDDYVLLFYSDFIIEQLSTLHVLDPTLESEILFEECYFMIQYKKRAEQFMNLKHEKKRRKRDVCKSLMDKSCGGTINFSVKEVIDRPRTKKEEPIIPIGDNEYWKSQLNAGVFPILRPLPQSSNQLLPNHDSDLLGKMLEAYSILSNYKDFLSLPNFPIEVIADELQRTSGNQSTMREIQCQLLLALLLQRKTAHNGFAVVANHCPSDNVASNVEASLLWDSIHECCNSSRDPYAALKQFLEQGDMWFEVVRIMIPERHGVRTQTQRDTVFIVQGIVEDLLQSTAYQSLLTKETDTDVMRQIYPQDLFAILGAIKCGHYDYGVRNKNYHNATDDENLTLRHFGISLRKGTKIDAYSTSLLAWYPARVEEVFVPDGEVLIRYEGWGKGCDDRLGTADYFLAPYKTLSLSVLHRNIHPSLIPVQIWMEMEESNRKVIIRNTIRDENYSSHMAVAADVRRVLSNSSSSSSSALWNDLLREFDVSYKCKILECSSMSEESQLGKCMDSCEVVEQLPRDCYDAAPISVKVKILCWLCTEMVATLDAKKFLETVMEQKLASSKVSKLSNQPKDPHKVMTSNGLSELGKRAFGAVLDEDNASSCKNSSPLNDISSFCAELRLKPLGQDRNENVYWSFRDYSASGIQVFCEDRKSLAWTVYSAESDLILLLSWLSDHASMSLLLNSS